jgi:membrane protease YdiL (CAAX protease family)
MLTVHRTLWSRLTRFALVRAALGALLLIVAMSVVMVSVESLPPSARLLWPSVLSAVLMATAYTFYVRRIEHQPSSAFAVAHAPLECGIGVVAGAALVAAVFAALAALQVFHLQGRHPIGVTAAQALSEMVLVAFFEEILVRGIVLKALERPLGSVGAVLVSSLLFGLAHVPNAGATLLSTLNVTLAGVMFGMAFIATGRLWLPIALHLGWNFTAGYVFSAAVSGHDVQTGFLFGQLTGPDWMTGGAFGIEGSVVTSLALALGTALLAALYRRARRSEVDPEPELLPPLVEGGQRLRESGRL